MCSSPINFGHNSQLNPNFQINYRFIGEIDDWITVPVIGQIQKFVDYTVSLLDINSLWSKFKKLLVVFEETEDEELDGLCLDNGEEGIIKIFLYDLIESIESIKDLLVTVAHELIHVRQFCDRRLTRIFKRIDGKVIGCYSWSDTGEIYYGEENVSSYRNLPWESEAFSLQSVIVDAFHSGVATDKVDSTKFSFSD